MERFILTRAAGLALIVLLAAAPEQITIWPALRPASAAEPTSTPDELPPGDGREDTFYRCTACHSTAVIRRSALSRAQWDELMDWMTEKHAMPPLEGDERDHIVGYLARAFPPRAVRGGPRGAMNPFARDD